MASPIVKGQAFGATETVTAAKLQNIVDNAAFKDFDGSTEAFNVSGSSDIGTCVLAGGLSVKTSTGQLQLKSQSDQTVIGNVSGGAAVPTAVPIVGAGGILLNNDALGTSDTKGATQGNIKAYIDSYALKYSGATGTLPTLSTSFVDFNVSSIVGSNRAMVIIEVFDSSSAASLLFRPKGSTFTARSSTSNAGYGASGLVVDTSDQGGIVVLVTDSSGIIEVRGGGGSQSGINYKIHAFQKLL
jgi:hypothetical protein